MILVLAWTMLSIQWGHLKGHQDVSHLYHFPVVEWVEDIHEWYVGSFCQQLRGSVTKINFEQVTLYFYQEYAY